MSELQNNAGQQYSLTAEPSEMDWVIYTGTGYAYLIGDEKAPYRRLIQKEERGKLRLAIQELKHFAENDDQLEAYNKVLDEIGEL